MALESGQVWEAQIRASLYNGRKSSATGPFRWRFAGTD